MAYSELIKNFERIREYMRQFYVYGFKSRDEYDIKSKRSYDNERRRIESFLGVYMSFRQDQIGKSVFLSVDSRSITQNPLYNAFKAKSFTDGDITFHFIIMDILADGREHTIKELIDTTADDYLSCFDLSDILDESSVRKKLKEYEKLGLVAAEKRGRELVYRRTEVNVDLESWREAATFYAEADPMGVVGSFVLDKLDNTPDYFSHKHHYILHAIDSEILYGLLSAIWEHRAADITVKTKRGGERMRAHTVFPYKIYVSVQSGREYLLCYHYKFKRPMFFRLDTIRSVKQGSVEKQAEKYSGFCKAFSQNTWGVSGWSEPELEHLEMTVRVGENESYILDRLERERRCARLEVAGEGLFRVVADVYDTTEMLPWIRTFTGRITELRCSNSYVTDTFHADLERMRALYGGEPDAVQ